MTTLINASDTYLSQRKDTTNFGTLTKMFVSDNTGTVADRRDSVIYFARPVKTGENVSVGKLRLWSGNEFAGTIDVSVRPLGEGFKVNRSTWKSFGGRIAVRGTKIATVQKTNAPAKTLWEFDVKSMLQDVATGGAPWYGFRIEANGSVGKWFYTAEGPEQYRPTLEVVTLENPEKPTELYPRNNMAVSVQYPTLRWRFTDFAGDKTMQAFRIWIYGTKADADAQVNAQYDSGQMAGTVSSFDTDLATGWAGIAAGSSVWWRVQHWDGAGLESPISDPVQFKRTDKQAAAWVFPTVPVVNDPTPPFSWTFPDQVSYQLLILDPAAPAEPLYDSGVITSADRFHTPTKSVLRTGQQYRVEVRLWDSVVRADLEDDHPWVTLSMDLTYEFSATVAPPDSLTATISTVADIWVDLEWTRAQEPDEFIIYRGDEEVERGDALEFRVAAGVYRFTDRLADPRQEHTYVVVAVVNGVASANGPTDTIYIVPKTTILSTPDGTRRVSIWNPSREAALGEDSEVHRLLGDAAPVLIVQSLRPGYEGKCSGLLVEDFGVDTNTQRDHMEWYRRNTGIELRLTYVDRAMKIVAYNIDYEPLANADGSVDYAISFEFFEV